MVEEELEVTTMSEKGQVVIPQSIRVELGLKPKTKFLVYGRGDTIILRKLELPDLGREWDGIFEVMDKKGLKTSEKEIQKEISVARRSK